MWMVEVHLGPLVGHLGHPKKTKKNSDYIFEISAKTKNLIFRQFFPVFRFFSGFPVFPVFRFFSEKKIFYQTNVLLCVKSTRAVEAAPIGKALGKLLPYKKKSEKARKYGKKKFFPKKNPEVTGSDRK